MTVSRRCKLCLRWKICKRLLVIAFLLGVGSFLILPQLLTSRSTKENDIKKVLGRALELAKTKSSEPWKKMQSPQAPVREALEKADTNRAREKKQTEAKSNQATQDKIESKPAQPDKTVESKLAQPDKTEKSKPAQPSKTEESKPAQPDKTEESKPAQPSKTEESKPAQPDKTEESKPAQPDRTEESKPAQPDKTEESKPTQPDKNVESKEDGNKGTNEKKTYLIYVCDSEVDHSEIGSHQRVVVGLYVLAELTSRIFGIIMTEPVNLTDYYKPNDVKWVISHSELEGKSTKEINAFGPKENLNLDKIDFNKEYPQDVIYIRTNQFLHDQLMVNPNFLHKYPKWAIISSSQVFPVVWKKLMMPAEELRQAMNTDLSAIALKIKSEREAYDILIKSKCCDGVHVTTMCPSCEYRCKTEDLANNNDTGCMDDIISKAPNTKCVYQIRHQIDSCNTRARLEPFAAQFCYSPAPVLQPNTQAFLKLQGYETVEVALVCVHITIGEDSKLPSGKNIRNSFDLVVWKFLKSYVQRGYHVYLVTDSKEIRQRAHSVLGARLHISSEDIVHHRTVRKGQDEKELLRMTLSEQLLMATSCNVLVISNNDYGVNTASIREYLRPQWQDTSFMFKDWQIKPTRVQF